MHGFLILFIILSKYYPDLQKGITASLATIAIPLGGSSRITDGFSHGKAHGNQGNIGDTNDEVETNNIILSDDDPQGLVVYCSHDDILPPLKSRDVAKGFSHKF